MLGGAGINQLFSLKKLEGDGINIAPLTQYVRALCY